MISDPNPRPIVVLGLGAMGATIARVLVGEGHHVTIWNRTSRTQASRELAALPGVQLAETVEAAVEGAALVVVCVLDHEVAGTVIDRIEGDDDLVVVNLTTGTPDQTAGSAQRAAAAGLRYVTGAIMVPTPLVGTAHCEVLYAGDDRDLALLTPLTEAMGGRADFTGTDHAVPAALDLAMLDIYFAGMYSYFHAAALAGSYGISSAQFAPYAGRINQTLGASLPGLERAMTQRTYNTGEASLAMCRSFLDHVVRTSRAAGIAPGLAQQVLEASDRALAVNDGTIDWDVVAEDFLAPTGTNGS